MIALAVMSACTQNNISHSETVKSAERPRILILDDEPAIQFAYRRIIESEGMQVDSSSTLSDAINRITERPYLAVIADVRLSGSDNQDGLEFLRYVRSSHPTTRMILATGYGNHDIRNKAHALGADHYFVKPVPPDSIISALKGFTSAPA